jgi:hypothetical protein
MSADVSGAELQELRDIRDIYDVVARYCRGLDRRDMALVRSAYHTGAVDHHAGFDGSVDQFIEWVTPLMQRYTSTSHFIGNHLVSVRGDRAVSETYNISVHRVSDPNDTQNFTVGVRYVDRMERRDGRWGIVERWTLRDWIRTDTGQVGHLGDGPRGAAHPHDALYAALDWLEA